MYKFKCIFLVYIVYKNMDLIGNVVTVLSLIKYTYQGFNYIFSSNNKTEIDKINENDIGDSDIIDNENIINDDHTIDDHSKGRLILPLETNNNSVYIPLKTSKSLNKKARKKHKK